ncbi:MAG: type II toxin-antitoxin system RelE/ParE family toxin [Candidatus Binatia bacterium]
MNYRLLVRRPAKAEVYDTARRYELQRPGLGREFVAEVDAALSRIAENPLQYQVLHREARRVIVRRFPYGVFYRIEANNIVVFCVDHLHRNPASWKARSR